MATREVSKEARELYNEYFTIDGMLPEDEIRPFMVWAVKRFWDDFTEYDQNVINVIERHMKGEATDEELTKVEYDAHDAALLKGPLYQALWHAAERGDYAENAWKVAGWLSLHDEKEIAEHKRYFKEVCHPGFCSKVKVPGRFIKFEMSPEKHISVGIAKSGELYIQKLGGGHITITPNSDTSLMVG